MQLPGLIAVPDGYKWDDSQNICIPIPDNKNMQPDDNPENAEFATFSGKNPEQNRAELIAFCKAHKDVCKFERPRLVDSDVCFGKAPVPLSRPGRWQNPDEYRGKQTRYAVQIDSYSDGTERTRMLAIENPRGVYVHDYGNGTYKVVLMVDKAEAPLRGDGETRRADDAERWQSNLTRARNAIEDYALCNPWQYFATLTIDGDKLSRDDLETYRKRLQQMIRNLKRNSGIDITYLLVPELHPDALADGRQEWHLHGLMNIPTEQLEKFTGRRIYGKNGDKFAPKYVRDKLKAGQPIYWWKPYNKGYGYSILEPVRDREAAARYLLKYVTKGQRETAQHLERGQNLYYHSTGLQTPKKVAPVTLARDGHGNAKTADGRSLSCTYAMHYGGCIVEWYKPI